MPTLDLSRDDILTALRVHLMLKGFPFHSTKKPVFNPKDQWLFGFLEEKLFAVKADFISKKQRLPESEQEACSIDADFTTDELAMLGIIFDAIAGEFPPSDDMDLQMHVPSREAFDSLHSRLKKLIQR